MISGKKCLVLVSSQLLLNTALLSKAVPWLLFLASHARIVTPKPHKSFASCRASGALLRVTFLPTSTRTTDGLGRMQTLSSEPSTNSILLLAVMQQHSNRMSPPTSNPGITISQEFWIIEMQINSLFNKFSDTDISQML
jgi:hypothetical protein